MPAPRNYTAEYVAARETVRGPDSTNEQRETARRLSSRIASAARRAGAPLDEIDLDEVARVNIYG